MAVSQIIGASIADGAIAAIDITDGTITTAKLAATTGSGNVVLSAAPTLTGNTSLVNLTVSGTQTNSTLTSGRVHYSTTGGLLTDSSNLQFDGSNLGVGITPSAWHSSFKAVQTGLGAAVYGRTATQDQAGLSVNYYYDGTNLVYIGNGYANRYEQESGSHKWFNAPSGTTGNQITFTQAMTLDASGYLGIGTTAPSSYGGLAVRKAVTVSSVPVSASFSDSANSTFDIRHSANIVNLSAQGSGITINTGNSTRMTITDEGLVGIGTTSPADALNIGNGKKFRATHSANVYQQIFSSASGNFLNAYGDNFELNADSGAIYLTVTAAQPMVFQTTNTERMRISAAGLVGIGTTSPDAQLDVTRSGDGQIAVLQTSANRGFSFESQSNTALQISSVQASTNMDLWADTLSFSAGGTEKMRITSAGNVGIGTSSPATFSVGGTPILVVGNNAQTQITLYGGSSVGDINFATSSSGVGLYSGVVRYDGTSNFMSFWTNSTERMRISSDGNVGIGTSSPSNYANYVTLALNDTAGSLIELKANGTANGELVSDNNSFQVKTISSIPLVFGTVNTERMRIDSSGNVLVGSTSAPTGVSQRVLQVTNGTNGIVILGSGATLSPNPRIFGGDTYDLGLAAGVTTGKMVFYTNDTERMRITSDGSLLVGTTNTQAPFVNGSTQAVFRAIFSKDNSSTAFDSAITQLAIDNINTTTNNYSQLAFTTSDGTNRVVTAGIYAQITARSSANWTTSNLQFYTGTVGGPPTEKMRIDSAGNVGIGVSPSDKLHIENGTLRISGTTAQAIYLYGAATVKPYITLNEFGVHNNYIGAGSTTSGVLSINGILASSTGLHVKASNGFVGMGTSSPSYNLQVYNDSDVWHFVAGGATGQVRIGGQHSTFGVIGAYAPDHAARDLLLQRDGGNLLVGVSSNAAGSRMAVSSSGITIYGTGYRQIYMNGQVLSFWNGSNEATLTQSGVWTNASDSRLKKNITNIKYGLNTVLITQPRSFERNDVEGNYIGFIAQELKEHIPEVVYGEKQLSVDYGSLVAVAFKAIQEQQALIESLTERLTALEGK